MIHPSEIRKEAIQSALNEIPHERVTIYDFPEANHDFTKVNKKGVLEFMSNFSETIIDWIIDLM